MGVRYREMEIRTAAPEKLVVLLYEGAMQHARRARECHLAGQIGKRGESISRALAIVAELQNGLDLEVGGEIARNLHNLYLFVADRLLEANVRERIDAIDEALRVLEPLHEAWTEIARNGSAPKPEAGA